MIFEDENKNENQIAYANAEENETKISNMTKVF